MISTEQLLTSPDGFGIRTATPAQRAACRVLDGRPLAELAGDADVLALVGGAEALAALPSELGHQPVEVVFLASVRSAKTIIACAAALRMSQAVDVSKLGHGEIPRVSLVSLRLDQSAVAYRLLHDTIRASKALRPLLIEATGDALTLRHPSGRPVEIAVVAGSKAGGSLVSRWAAGAVFDEAPRMSSAADALVNLGDARTAILGRLLPGAQALYIGSPWAPSGDVYDLVAEHWAKPSEHMVVLRGTGPMLNPVWWTPKRCAELERRNATAYRTDVMGEFADPESGLLNPGAVERATRAGVEELPPDARGHYFAAVDPSEGGAGGNGFALAIVQAVPSTEPVQNADGELELPTLYRTALVREWRGLTPSECWYEIARACKRYRVAVCRTDQYAASANADLARLAGLALDVDKSTATSKLEDFTNFATLLHAGRLELSPLPTLRRDLLSIRKRVTQQGSSIVLPRTSDGRHADLASALVAALKDASERGGVTEYRYDGVPDTRHAPPRDTRPAWAHSEYAPKWADDDGPTFGAREKPYLL